jgi:hypothetical protein
VDIIEAVAENQLTSSAEVLVVPGGKVAGDPESALRSRARVLQARLAGRTATIRWDAGVASRLEP